jgi:[ribosomal protein S5]-alanine N-acetyltransferase
MRLRTARLELRTLTTGEWAEVAEGESPAAAADYPSAGDVIGARFVVAGDWPVDGWGPWQVRRLSDGLAIGGVGCKGRPDDRDRVEIGYGLVPSARGHGYATEAVLRLVEWLRSRSVREVVAETDGTNTASMAVLRRAHFTEVERTGDVVIWSRRC